MKILAVPMKVEAMVSENPVSCISTTDDFSKLPYLSKNKIDVNYDVANLASSIARKPYNNHVMLPAGVHLHWTVPAAMKSGEADDDGIDLPKVPNRYLVKRIHKVDSTKNMAWIIESDYLHPEGDSVANSVCIPNLDKQERSLIPYRYLGRQVLLTEWEDEQAKRSSGELLINHEYLPSLTALGWGSPYFSALYSNCFSVFGAHDSSIKPSEVNEYEYQVFGWYSDAQTDYIQQHLTDREDGDTFEKRAKAVAHWELVDETAMNGETNFAEDVDGPDASVCYGKVIFNENIQLTDGIDASLSSVAFAKNSEECMAAYLANVCSPDDEAQSLRYENQLQALLFTDDVQGENLDFIDRLKNARHRQAFEPVTSGDLWSFIDEASLFDVSDTDASNDQVNRYIESFKQFKEQQQGNLIRLNNTQEAAHRNSLNIENSQRVLYNEWSKYMLCLHPTDMNNESYPDSDWLRHKMQAYSIPALVAFEVEQDRLSKLISTYKSDLAVAFRSWKNHLGPLATNANQELLTPIAGPRYWRMAEPSILIDGPVTECHSGYGCDKDDHKQEQSTYLPCSVIVTEETSINDLVKQHQETQFNWFSQSVNHWQRMPWQPVLMEWRCALFAEDGASRKNNRDYVDDFIVENQRIPLNSDEYGLPSAATDLQPKLGSKVELETQPNVIVGRSMLSFSIKKSALNDMKSYLDDYRSEHLESQQADTQEINASGYSGIKTLYTKLQNTPCVIQGLDGLHDELLMYSNLTLLKMSDPARFSKTPGFDDDISDQVNACLKNQTFSLPSFSHEFTPIKSGVTTLQALRIVDSFGRTKDINTDQIIRSQRQVVGNSIYAPPRVVQPLRLHFRWQEQLDIDSCTQTPVCGWLCYNVFDETLAIYNAQGAFQGQINSDGEWQDKRGKAASLSSIKHPMLKQFTEVLRSFHGPEESQSEGRNYLPYLKKAILRAQDNIEPENEIGSTISLALKPLAIVNASIDLQLMGPLETDKSWASLIEECRTGNKNTRAYGEVKFPVKLGEYNNLNDGLVAYWKVDSNKSINMPGYFPQSDMDDVEGLIDAASFHKEDHDYVDQQQSEGVANLTLSLNDEKQALLLLMDAEANVHATTGVLPKKALSLPESLYEKSLKEMDVDYFSAPILTSHKQLSVPLSDKNKWRWSQLDGNGNEKNQVSNQVVVQSKFIDLGGTEDQWLYCIEVGILNPLPKSPGVAYLDLSCADRLIDNSEAGASGLVDQLRNSQQAGMTTEDKAELFSDRTKAVEGWLTIADN